LHKLVMRRVCGRLLRWVSDFLSERSAHVRYADSRSADRAYRFGIPQGSVLSPVASMFSSATLLAMSI
jgi:hypothetical protein